MGCDVGLEAGQRLLRLVGQALGDEADQLAELHDGALHVAELVGDVLGRADGELLLEAALRSSSAPTPRTLTTAQWAPRRVVSRQTRAERSMRLRRCGSRRAMPAAARGGPEREPRRFPPATTVRGARHARAVRLAQRRRTGSRPASSSASGSPHTSHDA